MATINIDFNARDKNFDSVKRKYTEIASLLTAQAANASKNSSEQRKFIEEEIKAIERQKDAWKAMSSERRNAASVEAKDEMNKSQKSITRRQKLLENDKRKLEEARYNGTITGEEYQTKTDSLDRRNQRLTKDTNKITTDYSSKMKGFNTNEASQKALWDNIVGELKGLNTTVDDRIRELMKDGEKNAMKQIKAIERDDNADPIDREAAKRIRQSKANDQGEDSQSILANLLGANNIINGIQAAKGLATSNNSLDLYSKFTDTIGAASEGLIGGLAMGIAEAFTGKAGKNLVKAGGAVIGNAVNAGITADGDMRRQTMEARERLDQTRFGNRALSGQDDHGYDASAIGMDVTEFAQSIEGILNASGTNKNVTTNAFDALNLQKGWNIDMGTSHQLLELMRSMSSTDRSLTNLVGGVWEKGQSIFKGDRTYLNEFMDKNFMGLQKELTKNQRSVDSGKTMELLTSFDKLGGQFGAKHQNSMGLISGINNALINPQSEALNAISFDVLRKANPNMDFFELQKERQKGLGSPELLKGMIKRVGDMGGDESVQKMRLAQALGMSGNLEAVETLWNNKSSILDGSFKGGSLFGSAAIKGQIVGDAEANTTDLEKADASIRNKILQGDHFETLMELGHALNETIDRAFNSKTFTMYEDVNGRKRIEIHNTRPHVNTTSKPKGPVPQKVMSWMDTIDSWGKK